MQKISFLIAGLLLACAANAQTTLTLQPDSNGKDAEVFSCVPCGYSVRNFGKIAENCAISWTKSGSDHKIRSYMQFNLTSIPLGAHIISASLSLCWTPNSDEGNHYGISGNNGGYLLRVTSPWYEHTITWNTQPTTTNINRVSFPGTTSGTQNYPNIDVATLVQDMVDDPANSFGFMLRLQTEAIYRKLVFASSDNSNAALRPKLVVVYSVGPSHEEDANNRLAESESPVVKIFPNPVKEVLNISITANEDDRAFVSVFDLAGNEMLDRSLDLKVGENIFFNDCSKWPRGLYMILVKTGGEMITEKILLQ